MSFSARALTWVVTLVTFVALDLLFVGVIAKPLYVNGLAHLKRESVNWLAAGLFYALYPAFVTFVAVLAAGTWQQAFIRGALMGLFAYGTYEFTNWALLNAWPAKLVPIDIAWGMAATGTAALVGKLIHLKLAN